MYEANLGPENVYPLKVGRMLFWSSAEKLVTLPEANFYTSLGFLFSSIPSEILTEFSVRLYLTKKIK